MKYIYNIYILNMLYGCFQGGREIHNSMIHHFTIIVVRVFTYQTTLQAPHRFVDVPLDQDVEDGKCQVSQELPDLSSQQHPDDPVRGMDPDPAPAHRHLRRIVANLVQAHGCNSDGQRNTPARQEQRGFNFPTSKVNIQSFNISHHLYTCKDLERFNVHKYCKDM